jgi:hypothetical protein
MFTNLIKHSQKFIFDNSPAILTALGVVGTVSTAVLAGRAAVRATDVLREAEQEAELMDEPPLSARDKVELTWDIWAPTVASGVLTVSATISSNYISTKRATAIATAYAIAERAFDEYRGKVTEKVGSKKEQGIRDDLAQDRLTNNPVSQAKVHATGRGEVLCYDTYTGRYFYSDMEELRRAENHVNHTVLNNYYASLTDLYSYIGLDRTKFSDDIGWNSDRLLELEFSTMLADDGRPCIVIDFRTDPVRYYDRIQ